MPQTILDQVWITTSGIFNEPPLYAALTTFGIDRVMFSIDYPYSTHMMGRQFLDKIWLAPANGKTLPWHGGCAVEAESPLST